jgi:hypothetical protein
MTRPAKIKLVCGLAVSAAVLQAPAAHACAACYGKSDSPLALGMNWGIYVLLGFISMVLSGFAGFGFYLARRSAAVSAAAAANAAAAATEPTPKA